MVSYVKIVASTPPNRMVDLKKKHQHVLNVARALLFQANLPTKFWAKSVLAAVYLINRTPSNLLNGKTPYELLYLQKPSYDHIKVFGTHCFAQVKRNKDQFSPRGRKSVTPPTTYQGCHTARIPQGRPLRLFFYLLSLRFYLTLT